MDQLFEFDDSDPRIQLWSFPTAPQSLQLADGSSTMEHDTQQTSSFEQHHQHHVSQPPLPPPPIPQHTTASVYQNLHAITHPPAGHFFPQAAPWPYNDLHDSFTHTYPPQHQQVPPQQLYMPLTNQPLHPNYQILSEDSSTMDPPTFPTPVIQPNPLAVFPEGLRNNLVTDPPATFSTSPSSDGDSWYWIDSPSHDLNAASTAVDEPARTLHLRTDSDGTLSQSNSGLSPGSTDFEEVPPFPVSSPEQLSVKLDPPHANASEEDLFPPDRTSRRRRQNNTRSRPMKKEVSRPIGSSSSSSTDSPPPRQKTISEVRSSGASSSSSSSSSKKSGNALGSRGQGPSTRRIGKRKGPLSQEQRQQAGQIRKLRACIRCKFLKKTCDTGDPCQGCKPHHVRNWVVPCARIDIKDVSYFMKHWQIDFDRHINPQTSFVNIRHFSPVVHHLWITHGFGFALPIEARQVWVYDMTAFDVDWWETQGEARRFTTSTSELTAGGDGVSLTHLSQYLDRHVEEKFPRFAKEHFGGTPFLTELLVSAHTYMKKTELLIVRKALKFVVAYNLTLHITLIEGLPDDVNLSGKIDDPESKYFGKTLAPGLINLQVKFALAKLWRDLHNEVLDGLSKLLTGVYSGDKLKNWPTIFVVTALLLTVWEEMQFDTKFRRDGNSGPDTFCQEMEGTPLGVIVGLFAAVSQKVPAFIEWDTQAHHAVLNGNQAACDLMTEVRDHVKTYDDYLKNRKKAQFDPTDFDSLSNTFLSKLVIRAN